MATAPFDEIRPGLFLGSLDSLSTLQTLRDRGVNQLISVYHDRDAVTRALGGCDIAHHYMDVPTSGLEGPASFASQLAPTLGVMDAAVGCIGESPSGPLASGCLVHCGEAISRSPALVAAYLMWAEGRNYERALRAVRARRPAVHPSEAYHTLLTHFDDFLDAAGALPGAPARVGTDNRPRRWPPLTAPACAAGPEGCVGGFQPYYHARCPLGVPRPIALLEQPPPCAFSGPMAVIEAPPCPDYLVVANP